MKDIKMIEKVQENFVRRIPILAHLTSYEDRCKSVNLDTLFYRSVFKDMVLVFKIVNNLVDIPFDSLFTFSHNVNLRGHSLKLFVQRSNLNIRKNFFSNRVVDIWNSLPDHVVSSVNVCLFKLGLSACLKDHLPGVVS